MNKTIAKVGFAMVKTQSETAYTYDSAITYFESAVSGGRNLTASPIGEPTTVYADGLPVDLGEDNAGYEISLELLDIVDDISTKWLNQEKRGDGILEVNKSAIYPNFALIVANEAIGKSGKYEITEYFDVNATKRPEIVSKTSEGGSFDIEFPVFSLKANPRKSDKYIKYTYYADTLPEAIVEPARAVG